MKSEIIISGIRFRKAMTQRCSARHAFHLARRPFNGTVTAICRALHRRLTATAKKDGFHNCTPTSFRHWPSAPASTDAGRPGRDVAGQLVKPVPGARRIGVSCSIFERGGLYSHPACRSQDQPRAFECSRPRELAVQIRAADAEPVGWRKLKSERSWV